MISLRVFICLLLACSVVSELFAGPSVVTYFGVTPQSQQITLGSRGWIVSIGGVTNPGPSGSILVEAVDGSTPIERIIITPAPHPSFGSAQDITLNVRRRANTNGTIPCLGTILRTGTSGDLWIGTVTIDGTLGDLGNIAQDSIIAQSVSRVQAAEVAGTITSLGSSRAVGAITSITASAGGIFGTITANASINEILATSGSIGDADHPAIINSGTGLTTLRAQSIQAAVDTGTGQIQTFQASAGDFAGSLETSGIGTSGSGFSVAGSLTAMVTVSGNVNMDFVVTGSSTATVSMTGTINQPVAFNGGVSGGSVTLGALANPLVIAGSLGAPLMLGSISTAGSLSIADNVPSGRTVTITGNMAGLLTIGGSLAGNLTVGSSGNPGLSGQVIINRNNVGGTWTGNVRVGGSTGTVLTPVVYAQTPTAIGGGAVGLAPFRLYYTDCTPTNSSYFRRTDFEPTGTVPNDLLGAVIRYYGPIARGPGPQVVVVERQMRDMSGNNVWGPVTEMFTATLNPAGVPGASRALRVHYSGTAGDLATGRYRISILPEGVVCSGVVDTPDVVFENEFGNPYYYFFNIGLDCSTFDCMGTVGSEDFIPSASWSRSIDCDGNNINDECDLRCDEEHVDKNRNGIIDICETIMGPCPCNFNADAFLNSQDFFDFIGCFFTNGCSAATTMTAL